MINLPTFHCQTEDDGDHWEEVEAWNLEDAAASYAEDCDDASGGEFLSHPRATQPVRVRDAEMRVHIFNVRVDFTKVFYAEPEGE